MSNLSKIEEKIAKYREDNDQALDQAVESNDRDSIMIEEAIRDTWDLVEQTINEVKTSGGVM